MAKMDINGSGSVKGSSGSFVDTFKDISYDQDYDIINSYNFMLRVEGIFSIAVRSVRGINKQNEFEYIQEGGLNDYVHMLRKPISQPFTFQVERYVSQDWLEDFYDPLALGTEFILPLILYINRLAKSDGKIPVRYYIFTNARVIGTQIGDLDAEKSGLHTVTYTIAYANLISFTVPIAQLTTTNPYKFNKDNAPNLENDSARTNKNLGIERANAADAQPVADNALQNPPSVRTKGEMEAIAKKVTSDRREEAKKVQDKKKTDQETADKEKKLPRKYLVNEQTHAGESSQRSAVINNDPTKDDMLQRASENTAKLKEDSVKKAAENKDKQKAANEKLKVPRKYIVNPNSNALSKKSAVEADNPTRSEMEAKAKENTGKVEQAMKDKAAKDKSAQEAANKKLNVPRKYPDQESAVKENNDSKETMEGKSRVYPKSQSAVIEPNESRAQMEAKARRYPPTNSAVIQKTESMENMAKKARKYPPTRSARQVADFLKS